jgi:hypothetical protein
MLSLYKKIFLALVEAVLQEYLQFPYRYFSFSPSSIQGLLLQTLHFKQPRKKI